MSYTDLRDFKPEWTGSLDDCSTVEIEKLGGGTVGKAYEGAWRYRHTDGTGVIHQGQDLTTGMPKTHAEVAEIVSDYFWEEG